MENNPSQVIATPPMSPVTAITPEQPKPKMKRWKKVLLWTFGIIVFLVIVALNLPRILTLMFPHDAQLVDDSNIRLTAVSVPNSDNGFFAISQITPDMLYTPADDKNFDLEYTNYTQPVKWNQQAADDVLSKNQQALNLFSQAATKPYLQIPDYSDPTQLWAGNVKLQPLNQWRMAARMQAIKALSLSYQGKSDEALQEAVKIDVVGHNIIKGHNSLIGELVGLAMQKLGSDTLLQILPYGSPSTSTLATVKSEIQNSSDNLQGYKDAFSFEYTNMVNSIDQLITKPLDEKVQAMVQNGQTTASYANYVKYGYYYKPNQTKNLYQGLYSQQIAAIGVRCEVNDIDEEASTAGQHLISWKLPFTENIIGKLMFGTTALALGGAITKDCQNDLELAVTQTQLALRQYKTDNGSLPTALTDLVPQYLDSVPLDPFDHEPLRYDAQKKILYSVGLNKKDLGGSTGNDWTKMDNPTFLIGF